MRRGSKIRFCLNHVEWQPFLNIDYVLFLSHCVFIIKMLFLTMIAMLPLSILSQGVSNSTVYSPECKKTIKALDSSCKAQLAEWVKFLRDSCPKAYDCTAEKVKSLCPSISKCSER